jgi:hypothetical protein
MGFFFIDLLSLYGFIFASCLMGLKRKENGLLSLFLLLLSWCLCVVVLDVCIFLNMNVYGDDVFWILGVVIVENPTKS